MRNLFDYLLFSIYIFQSYLNKKEVKTVVGKNKEKLPENNGYNRNINFLFRVLRTYSFKRYYRYTLNPWISILAISFIFGIFGGGLLIFFWGFMCGFIPTLPQPLPALINWSLFISIVILSAAVDYSRTH